jgi:uracil-DNA glycosylase family 4
MDALEQLQTQIRACRLCLTAGHTIAPGPVFSGRTGAQIMLIGQAPGPTEAQVKRPFNAGSGRRLFQWLKQAGWDEDTFRHTAYMSAVTKCYPGRSDTGKGDRVPSPAEQQLCRPFLQAEIRLVNPRLLLLIGGLAIKLLYPPSVKLADIIGTAVYFPPETLHDPLNFNLADGEILSAFDPTKPMNGRYVVPLPHPSGASLWPNRPENQALIHQALQLLATIRTTWQL